MASVSTSASLSHIQSSPSSPFDDYSSQYGGPSSHGAAGSFRHPGVALFHIVFKIAALLVYLFGGIFGQGFLGTFVALIILVSMDFWVVKNVTGRLLVGLRWWNHIDEHGRSTWIYENRTSKQQPANGNQEGGDFLNSLDADKASWRASGADSQIFWTALILYPMVWSLLLMVSLFRLNIQWFLLVCMALVLALSNLYGYFRCRFGTGDGVKQQVTSYLGKQLFFNLINSKSEAPERQANPSQQSWSNTRVGIV